MSVYILIVFLFFFLFIYLSIHLTICLFRRPASPSSSVLSLTPPAPVRGTPPGSCLRNNKETPRTRRLNLKNKLKKSTSSARRRRTNWHTLRRRRFGARRVNLWCSDTLCVHQTSQTSQKHQENIKLKNCALFLSSPFFTFFGSSSKLFSR